MKKFHLLQFFLFLFLLTSLGCFAKSELIPMRLGGGSLEVELADTPLLRQKGLQHRKSLPQNRAMLFVFPVSGKLSFWSKDTSIPLSIAFLDNTGKIVQIAELPPQQTQSVVSDLSVRYALEVNSGWFDKNSVGLGDFLRMERK
jgi:uncharacterized membrane protein (UPF0127 family)